MKKNKGITLIALVVTIVVLLILAGTTIMMIFGENGIVPRAAEAAFRQEIGEVREKIDLYLIEDQIKAEQEISFKEINIEDTKNWKYTLKQEIIFWGNYDIDVNEVTVAYINNNFEKFVSDNGKVLSIYFIQENGSSNKYIYNKETDIIYKINPTKIGKNTVHSIEELNYLKNGGVRHKSISSKNYTKIEYEAELKTIDGISYYEPNLNGVAKESTSLIFYKVENGQVLEEEKVVTAEKWLQDGRPNQIQDDTGTYVLYNYNEKIWANIRIESRSLETNWVWIPRCAYNESGTTTDTDVIFVGTDNKPIDGSELPRGYSIVGSFKNNQDMGIWVSKYQPSVN